ncbi:DNA polymerase II [Psychromonas sp. RZ22]|uniref:acyl-CoA dehydrogenase family protein n=1 Tax=Psychromonas algarum TaxID=2555643 RepID=UPI00106861C0|nr:acyl-CoA dehydrogenase family protein [Psychromonas sp. RZ22]TEW54169.1 DNA polymerase II [Psychromonas sp. RZ22]
MSFPEDKKVVIDTSKMSDEKASSLNITEDARESVWQHPSFAKSLFMGEYKSELIHPFPTQDPEEKLIGDALVKEVGVVLAATLDADLVDETRIIPTEAMQALAKIGVFSMKIPKKYGGLGLSQVNYNRVLMAIASHCGSTAVLVSAHQSIGVPQPIKLFGTEEQKQRFLPLFKEGAVSAFALTEPSVGSDPAQMQTTATLNEAGTHYLINGEKLWCTNGLIADYLVVMACTAPKIINGKEVKQISAFIVKGKSPGMTIKHRCDFMGIRGIQNGLIEFKDVEVAVEDRILNEGQGLKIALATLNTGRLTIPAASTGMAKQCLNMTRRWGGKRVQWGSPIAKHEKGSNRLAYIASTTFAMEAVTWLSSFMADKGDVDIRMEAAMAKLFCSEMAWSVMDETVQMFGGRGYEKASSLKARGELPFPVERMLRDCRINRIIEGTTDIMELFLSRESLDTHLLLASDLIKPGADFTSKRDAAFKLFKEYASWYPSQIINKEFIAQFTASGPLSEHINYCQRTSHRLARVLFEQMLIHREKLELRQETLGHLMTIGCEIFAMATTCSYAKNQVALGNANAMSLAEHHCVLATERIEGHFKALSTPQRDTAKAITDEILNDQYQWLEEGIYPIPEEG